MLCQQNIASEAIEITDICVIFFREAVLLCQLTNVLATGLMQPWYPVPKPSKQSLTGGTPTKKDGKKDKGSTGGKPAMKITTAGIDPDALAEIKQALEVLRHSLFFVNLYFIFSLFIGFIKI